ncbi:MAG: SufE family protein [Candidatus Udaeobacter sp.]
MNTDETQILMTCHPERSRGIPWQHDKRIPRDSSTPLRSALNDRKEICDNFSYSMYPTKLTKIINLFESLPEVERRETLVSYADNAKNQEPRESENFDLVDVRKDEECTDTVGVYLHVDENSKAHIRMTLGPEVQTLTRSMTAILCKGLEGSTPQEILDLPSDFVTRIVGTELVRIRSQTVYYVLTRIKSVCKVYLDRQRMAEVA